MMQAQNVQVDARAKALAQIPSPIKDLGVTLAQFLERLVVAEKRASKQALADACNVHWPTVHAWFVKGAIPSPKNLDTIAEVLKLSKDERAQLYKLAAQQPTAGDDTPPPTSDIQLSDDKRAFDQILTRAIDPERHTIGEAQAVLAAMREAGSLLVESTVGPRIARAWLDAALVLRERKQRITAAALAVLSAEALLEQAPKGATKALRDALLADDDDGDENEGGGAPTATPSRGLRRVKRR